MRKIEVKRKIQTGEIKIWSSVNYTKDILLQSGAYNGYFCKPETPIAYKQFPNLIVCLDNGHASNTAGKRSPYSAAKTLPALDFYEYQFNREIVARLKEELEKYGVTVYIVTPELDKDVSLTTRYTRANNFAAKNPTKKSLLVSIHANAYGNGKEWNTAKGWSAYTTKGQNNSDKFAECIYDAAAEIFPSAGMTIRKDLSDGDRDWESNFTIIYGANMPAVLTENFFYTNIADTEYLLSEKGINDVVRAHLNGILNFAESQYDM